MSDWAALIPSHHDCFIALDVFEANPQRLRAYWRAPKGALVEQFGRARRGAVCALIVWLS